MNLFEQIKFDMMSARWAGQKNRSALLGTILSEASRNDKAPSDDVTFSVLKKFKASAEEMLRHSDTLLNKEELAVICNYLPELLTESELKDKISALGVEVTMKNMKSIKTSLESDFPGQIDGSLLASVVKNWN